MKANVDIAKKSLAMILVGLLALTPQMVLAQPPVASGATRTTVTPARNGVSVVNIAAPNASGLSHNKYTSYNVGVDGIVLNNGDTSEQFRLSKLAGQVGANPNLAPGRQARTILNEVTGTSRSLLEGFTEVLGGKADVIVANPYGITCRGCGFINTDRVSIVTGIPNIAGGVLGGFDVRGGDILISGTGINAGAQGMLDLVSRRIVFDGQVNARTLNVIAGSNNWNHTTGATTPIASDGTPAPTWAIDSTVLGGMYAGRISLKSTEAGTGVKMLGEAAATADDFTITSSGKIEIRSKLSAAGDLALTSADNTAEAIKSVDANLTAGRNLDLTATSGGATLIGGSIVANGALNYALGTLTDTASATPDITDANRRYGNTLNLSGTGAWTIGGVSYGAGNSLTLAATNLSLGASSAATLYSAGDLTLTVDNITIGSASNSSSQILAATSGSGSGTVASTGTLHNYGILYSGQDLNVSASAITNEKTGGIAANRDLTLNATSGDLVNWGALYAGQDLKATTSGQLHNAADATQAWGTLDADRDITMRADREFLNESTINATGNITITSPNFRNEVYDGAVIWGPESTHITETVLGADVWKWMTVEHEDSYTTTWNQMQSYRGGVLFQPRIIAGTAGTLLIRQFDAGMNMGGYLSGDTVTLSGNGPGATFTNDAMTLVRRDFTHVLIQKFSTMMMPPLGIIPITPTSCTTLDYPTTWQDTTLDSKGAYIRANQLNASGFSLTNSGAPLGASVTPNSIPLTLPANPNGKFVQSKNPNSGYLVESNPLYTNIDNFLGSDYLAQKYNLNTDEIVKRLGDAAYETSLVRQQLVSQAGTTMLKGYTNEKEQMRGLMDHAGTQTSALGLKYGQPLTSDQQKNLKEDMVWMVETTVNGQKVLAPVVYLATATRAMFEPGNAVIAADKTKMNLTSLTNTGGTISGASSLNITSQGDIKNVSGTIKGGNVSLSSTDGSILSQTYTQTSGGPDLQKTTVGQQAGIVATGSLKVDAAKDITNLGAKMAAGGDATLSAGGNVTFDTVEKKEATSSLDLSEGSKISTVRTTDQIKSKLTSGGTLTVTSKGDMTLAGTSVVAAKDAQLDAGGNLKLLARENSREEITDVSKTSIGKNGSLWSREDTRTDLFKSRNVGSTITTNGNAVLSANKDVTIQGSDVKAKGDITISGEDVKVLAGKDLDRSTTTTKTISLLSITSGGNSTYTAEASADASADAAASIQGVGTAKAGASSAAKAKAAVAVPGMDDSYAGKGVEDLSETSSEAKADSSAGITAGTGLSAGAKAKAGVEARADMDAGGLDQYKVVVTRKEDENVKAVGSTLSSGKNIAITARKTATLQGAKVNAKGDVDLSGQDVKIMAAEDKHTVTENTTSIKQGVYLASDNKVKVDANLNADASAGLTSGHKEEIGAGVSGSVSSANTIDLLRNSTTKTDTVDTRNVGSSLSSGGNLKIASGNTLTVQGSELSGKKGVELKAREMDFLAGKDSHSSSTTTVENRMGLFIDGNAKAKADAGANGNYGLLGAGAGANAGAAASAEASAGVQTRNSFTTETERTTKARVSTIKSGSGSITRTAENSITDVGTGIDAAGDFSQTAKTYTSKATADTSEKTSSSVTNSAKLGMYAGASANAEASAGTSGGLGATADANADAKAKAVVGGRAAYSNEMRNESERATTAVVSSIKAGGTVKSVTTDKTSLEGTKISGGTAVELEAGSLDYAAAKNTTSKSSSSRTIEASGKVGAGVDATKAVAVDVELAGEVKGASSNENSSTAVTGGIASRGDIRIKTTGDTRLEGTKLVSAGDTIVDAGGTLTYDAARDTTHKDETSYNASGSVTTSAGKNALGIGAEASGGYSRSGSDTSTAHVDTDKEGNAINNITTGGDLTLKAGKTVTFEGTTVDAGGDATISGKEGVSFNAAKDKSSSYSVSANASLKLAGGTEKEDDSTKQSGSIEGSAGVNVSSEKKSDATAGSITTGGNLTIKSDKDVTLEGTSVEAGNKASIEAGGSVNLKAAESTSEKSGFGLNLSGKAEGEVSTKSAGASSDNSKPATNTSSGTDSGKKKNLGTGGTQGSDGSKKSDTALDEWQDKQAAVLKELKSKQSSGTTTKTAKTTETNSGTTDNGTTTARNSGSTTKKSNVSGSVGFNIQEGKTSTKTGGSIKAGAGGLEITAKDGNVTMEGTKLSTTGDANIAATGDVTITAAKSTESNFGVSVNTTGARKTSATSSSDAGGAQGKQARDDSGKVQGQKSSNNSSAPNKDTTKKKSQPAKKSDTKKKGAENKGKNKTGTTTKGSDAKSEANTDGTQNTKGDPFGNQQGATGTVGINIGNVVTGSQQSEITTGGKLNITSGGKTTLTDTTIKATGGQNINATGGTDSTAR